MSNAMITEQILNLAGLASENVRLLADQKIIPCGKDDFFGVSVEDENMRNVHTMEYDENGKPTSWYYGNLQLTVDVVNPDGSLQTKTEMSGVIRRDYFTANGCLYKTTMEDTYGTVIAQTEVEFNEAGVVVSEARRLCQAENLSKEDGVFDIRLHQQGESIETYVIGENGLPQRRLDSEKNVIESYEYDENNLLVLCETDYHLTRLIHDEHGNVKEIQKELKVERGQDTQTEITTVVTRYYDDVPGRIRDISIDGHILFDAEGYWAMKTLLPEA